MDRYSSELHFWKHQSHDVAPFFYCCKGMFSDCSAYYARRPSDNGNGYVCPPRGMIYI